MKKLSIAIVLTATLTSVSYASSLTNDITGLYNATKVPTAKNPVLCIKIGNSNDFHEWKYGKTLDPSIYSGSKGYFGVAVRQGGCSVSNLYFGWLGVYRNNDKYTFKYIPLKASHIQLLDYKVSGGKLVGHLGFTPIGPTDNTIFPTNKDTTKPSAMTWFTGINLSGLEFSTQPNASAIPDLSKAAESTANSDLKATATFLNQGANTIRLPVRWVYMQPQGPNSSYFDTGYFNDLVMPTLATITSHNYYAILDLHAYMHYATVGNQVAGCGGPDGKCPDGKLIQDPQAYVNIWSNMWNHIKKWNEDKKHPQIKANHLLFDIVNEPTADGKLTAQEVFTMEVAVMKKLRQEGYPGYFLLEGVHWSGLHSWEDAGNSKVFTRDNFTKAGIKDLSKIIINVHQYLDSDYSGTHNTCLQKLNTKGPNGFNLQQFVNYLQANGLKAMVTEFGVGSDQKSCTKPLKAFLNYLKANAYKPSTGYGFVGWTIWSTGHGWGNYNLRVKPGDWKDTIIEKYFKQPESSN